MRVKGRRANEPTARRSIKEKMREGEDAQWLLLGRVMRPSSLRKSQTLHSGVKGDVFYLRGRLEVILQLVRRRRPSFGHCSREKEHRKESDESPAVDRQMHFVILRRIIRKPETK